MHLVSFFDCSPPDISFCRGPGKRLGWDYDDQLGASDTLVEIASAVERPSFTNNFSLELGVIYPSDRFDKERWRWPACADDDAIFNEVTAGRTNVVFNGSDEVRK